MTKIRVTTKIDDDARGRIIAILDAQAAQQGHRFSLETRTYEAWEAGDYLGGLLGRFGHAFVFVELLAVAEAARGRGVGRSLMAGMEADARARGLSGVWLDTFSFQAPDFYRALGYREFGTIPDYMGGASRHFFAKRFD